MYNNTRGMIVAKTSHEITLNSMTANSSKSMKNPPNWGKRCRSNTYFNYTPFKALCQDPLKI